METLIGSVPDHWAQAPLHTLCDVLAGPSGASVRAADRVEVGVPIVSPRSLRDGRIVADERGQLTPDAATKLARYRLFAEDILCARTGEIGSCAITTEQQRGWLFPTSLLRLRPGQGIVASYLKYYLALPAVRDWLVRHATGTAIPAISIRAFGAVPVVLPPLATQAGIADALGALDDQVDIHERISRTAARLRDTLAPLLLTGAVMTEGNTPRAAAGPPA